LAAAPENASIGNCLDFGSTQNVVRMFKNKSELAKIFLFDFPSSALTWPAQELALE
jgi:hypothetical protein